MIQSHYFRLKNTLFNNRTAKINRLLKIKTVGVVCIFILLWFCISLLKNKSENYKIYKVERLADLLKIDITSEIQKQKETISYINELDQNINHYLTKNITGYISNLDVEKDHLPPSSSLPPASSQSDLDLYNSNNDKFMPKAQLYEKYVTCKDLQYDGVLQFQVNKRKNKDDLIDARRQILSWQNEISDIVQNKEEEENMSEEQIIEKHWFEFGHMSVWSETENCYLTFSRIIYIQSSKNYPKISFIRATAFDKDWNEIKGKRVPYSDVKIPPDFQEQLERLDKQLGVDQCEPLNKGGFVEEYHECLKRHNDNILKNRRYKKDILDKYFLTYPTVLNFHFKLRSDLSGPEDPHVILRKDHYGRDEPIIIFNLDDGVERKMHSILPHRRIPTLAKFLLPDSKGLSKIEKNWTPFFIPHIDYSYSELSLGYIHFVYSFMPLRILRCSLDNGQCEERFSADTLKLSETNVWGGLRGGTQFVPLPEPLPGVKGKNVWVSFAKTHTKDCGCGPVFYRAVLVVMIEENGIFHLELITPGIDFGIEPMDFGMADQKCRDKNVLAPNSIVSWYINSQDTSTGSFEDYLTITASEADEITKRIVVKGLLNYILNIYTQKHINEHFPVDEHSNTIIDKTRQCVKERILDICKNYGLTHSPS